MSDSKFPRHSLLQWQKSSQADWVRILTLSITFWVTLASGCYFFVPPFSHLLEGGHDTVTEGLQ